MASRSRPVVKKKRRRKQVERSIETREKLIEAAVGAICEYGFRAATTPVIAERAGMSRGALQYHFKTRFALLSAVSHQLSENISSEMSFLASSLPSDTATLDRRLDRALQAYWKIYNSDTFTAVLSIFLSLRNDSKHYRALQSHMQAFHQLNDEFWLKLVLDPKINPKHALTARRIMFSSLRGLWVGQILGTQPKSMDVEFKLLKRMLIGTLTGKI